MEHWNKLPQMHRIVVKVGTTQITSNGSLDRQKITGLCTAVSELRQHHQVVLVSSGAVTAGIGAAELQIKKNLSIPYKQAAAAIGQTGMMQHYAEAFRESGLLTGQVLLTKDVMENRERFLNASNTLNTLLKIGAVPVVNENDTMAVDEIKVGDNDRLAAMVAQLVNADLLILLSDVDGLYADYGNPEKQRLIPIVSAVDDAIRKQALPAGTVWSTGGMITKLDAAEMCMAAGISMVLADGTDPGIISDIAAGRPHGTLFAAQTPRHSAKKQWLLTHMAQRGSITVDRGAAVALQAQGSSLLAKGIIGATGNFNAGDGVVVLDPEGKRIAAGLTNYGMDEVLRILGKPSREILRILGYSNSNEVIHRDNLVLTGDDDS